MRLTLATLFAALVVSACSSTPSTPDSGPTPDSGLPVLDGGDAGPDAGPLDAGIDAGIDAGPDAGPIDAGDPDAGLADAGDDDAGEPDVGSGSDGGGDTENHYDWSIDAGFFTAKAGVACLNLNDGEFACYGEFKGYDGGGCTASSLFLTGDGVDPRPMTYSSQPFCPCAQDLSIRFAFPPDSGYSQLNYEVSACDSDGGVGGTPIILKTFDIDLADCH